MLNSLKIKNFKKFTELDLQNFSRVNVFVGNNNSGKSTILEAINLAVSEQLMETFSRCFRAREINSWQIIDEISYLFNQGHDPFELIFSHNNETHTVQINKSSESSPAKLNTFNTQNAILVSVGQYIYDRQEPVNLFYDRNNKNIVMNDFLAKNLCPVWLFNTNLPWMHNEFQGVQISKKDSLILTFLQQIDPTIINISLTNNEIYVDVGLERLVPLRYLGDGIVKIVGILVWVINAENGIALIDEIENGIYYKNIAKLIKYLDLISSQLNVQLFITTHSEDFIRKIEGFSDLSLYRLNAKFDGGVMRWDRDKTVSYTQDNSIDVR